jgi:hypothetical protein
MSSAVPASLACIAELLRCPACLSPLAAAQGSLICARRHAYDVARHGYVTLLPSAGRCCPIGDDAGMINARAAIMDAGHFEPLTTALAERACSLSLPDSSVVLDAGAGTGLEFPRFGGHLSAERVARSARGWCSCRVRIRRSSAARR